MILQEAKNTTARAKLGFLGFGGSGKTTTAAFVAAGLAQLPGAKKVVAMFDTENGSDFLIPLFEKAGVQFLRVKSRSFADLLAFAKEAGAAADVAIIDSVTHVWQDLVSSYQRKMRRSRLTFKDWGPIKDEWGQFSGWFVNVPVHGIVCGRAGYEYEFQTDDDGDKELVKTAVKMKAEGEMGYEPSLLIEMQRVPVAGAVTADPATHGWTQRAIVLKDRASASGGGMHGQVIDNPTFESFAPHFAALNLTGGHIGMVTQASTEDLFDSSDARHQRKRNVEITLELIEAEFVAHDLSGQKAESKKRTLELLQECFATRSWKALESMALEDLQDGLTRLREILNPPAPLPPQATAPALPLVEEEPAAPEPEPAAAAHARAVADGEERMAGLHRRVQLLLAEEATPEKAQTLYREMYFTLGDETGADDLANIITALEKAQRRAATQAAAAVA